MAPWLIVLALAAGTAPAAGDLQDDLEDIGGQIEEVQSQVIAAENEASDLGRQINATDTRMRSLIADLLHAERDLVAVANEIGTAEDRLSAIRADLDARYGSLDQTRRTLEATRQRARDQAVAAYMAAGTDLSGFPVASEEVVEVALTLEYAARAAEVIEQIGNDLDALELEQERQAGAISEREGAIEEEVRNLRVQRGRLEDLAEQVADRKRDVEAELEIQRTLLATVKRELDFHENELAVLEREQERIKELIRQAQSSEGEAPGILIRPVPGPITSGYGPRVHPILGTTRLHTGVDFSAGFGQQILAGADGTVILAAWFGGYGNTVIIDHGGSLSSLYAHQSDMAVSLGEQVTGGEVIGFAGSTGLSTGPHLHFEVRINGAPVDPAPYL